MGDLNRYYTSSQSGPESNSKTCGRHSCQSSYLCWSLYNSDWYLEGWVCACVYLPNPFPRSGCDTRTKYFSGVQLVWIQSSASLRLDTLLELKNLVYLTISPLLAQKEMDSCLSKSICVIETQKASCRIWTMLADSILYNNNRFAKWAAGFVCGTRTYHSFYCFHLWTGKSSR